MDFEEIRTFHWQQKIFSKTERAYFAQKENCKNDLEKRYHLMLKEERSDESENCVIFTYIDGDAYKPPDNFGPQNVRITKLRKNVENIIENSDQNEKSRKSIFINTDEDENKFRFDLGEKFMKMCVLADLEPTTLLATIFYRESDGLLMIFPDFTSSNDSYMLEIDQNSKQNYVYSIENLSIISDEAPPQKNQKEQLDKVKDETCQLMKKLNLTEEVDFEYPKFCRIVLLLEIVDGVNFEFDNLHVQFSIKLPKFCRLVEGNLRGSTHSSYAVNGKWNFGYCHSLMFDIDDEFLISQNKIDSIAFNFEVISRDSTWGIERREGLAAMKITALEKSADFNEIELSCYRDLQGGSSFVDFLERFFLGGIHKKIVEFDDGASNLYGNKTVSSGKLRVKLQKIVQMKQPKRSFERMRVIDEIINSCVQSSKATKLVTE